MKSRTRTIAISSIAALTLAAAPVSAFAATSHTHQRAAGVSRLDRSPDKGLRHAESRLDRTSLDRKSLDGNSRDSKSPDKAGATHDVSAG